MLNQTTNKIQRLGFGHKKIDAIKHQLIINGANEGNLPNPFYFFKYFINILLAKVSETVLLVAK